MRFGTAGLPKRDKETEGKRLYAAMRNYTAYSSGSRVGYLLPVKSGKPQTRRINMKFNSRRIYILFCVLPSLFMKLDTFYFVSKCVRYRVVRRTAKSNDIVEVRGTS